MTKKLERRKNELIELIKTETDYKIINELEDMYHKLDTKRTVQKLSKKLIDAVKNNDKEEIESLSGELDWHLN